MLTEKGHSKEEYWDRQAATFDQEPDHGLQNPQILTAWTELLRSWLPDGKRKILDVGCGTGSLSIVLASLGHAVTGIDFSQEMIRRAKDKASAAGYPIQFHVMNAVNPKFPPQQFGAIVCRHLLWVLPDINRVLERWADLLKPGGLLFLVEGYWHTGSGLHANEVIRALPNSLIFRSLVNLSDQPAFWGGKVNDERYAIVVHKQSSDN